MTPPFDSSSLSSVEKDTLIAGLLARVEELSARITAFERYIAALKILWGRRRDSCCKIVASINNPH